MKKPAPKTSQPLQQRPKQRLKALSARRKQARAILEQLANTYPEARIELCFDERDAWQLLVAVVLSAQCTDAKVNAATPALFDRFKDVHAFAKAEAQDIVPWIKTLGLANSKAQNLVKSARMIVDEHGCKVPQQREQLESLPGVGRKSASVILANAFGVPAIAVDTHVGRVSRRLGLTDAMDPSKVEAELEMLWPAEDWLRVHHTLIWHGRRCCKARQALCSECSVEALCPQIDL
jgi:endonuclease-3